MFDADEALPFIASTGAVWTPVRHLWVPTEHPKHALAYIDGNSGAEMGTVAANNTPQQVMPRDTWITIDLAPYGIPRSTVAILGIFMMVSSGYAGLPPVSFSVTVRSPGFIGLGLGDYIAATTAAEEAGYRSFVTCLLPVVDRRIEFSYQQPLSTTAEAIANRTGAPQILQLIAAAIFGG